MRLDAVAGRLPRSPSAAQSLQLFCIFHRIQLNLDWRSALSHTTPHRHTLTHTLNCKHTQTFTHTQRNIHLARGEMLIKWTGSNMLAGPFVVLRRALPLPHCITLAFLLHGISASTPSPLARLLSLTILFYFPTWQHWAPPGSAVVQNIIWHCILSSVFFWRN